MTDLPDHVAPLTVEVPPVGALNWTQPLPVPSVMQPASEMPVPTPTVFGGSGLLGVVPGKDTTEFKVVAAVVSFLQLLSAVVLALQGTGAFHLPDWVALGVPAVNTAVSGWMVQQYTQSRTDVKTAAITGGK